MQVRAAYGVALAVGAVALIARLVVASRPAGRLPDRAVRSAIGAVFGFGMAGLSASYAGWSGWAAAAAALAGAAAAGWWAGQGAGG